MYHCCHADQLYQLLTRAQVAYLVESQLELAGHLVTSSMAPKKKEDADAGLSHEQLQAQAQHERLRRKAVEAGVGSPASGT